MCQLFSKRLPFILILMPLLILLSAASSGYAAEVTLAWDNPGGSEVAGYKVYCGKSGTDFKDTPVETIASPDKTQCTVSGLEEGQTYALVATTIDGNGNESAFPDPIYYEVPEGSADSDGDGLTDDEETNIYGTDPSIADSDGDGIDDGNEVAYWGSDWGSDDDGDGIINLLDADSDNDGIKDGAEIEQGKDPSTTNDNADAFAWEAGDIEINHAWRFVPFKKSYNNPIVVAKPMSYNGSNPAVVRIRNVRSNGFEVQVQEWDYLDGNHATEMISYIAMESGRHALNDGTIIEASAFELNDSRRLSFAGSFDQTPVVVAGVTTYNGGQAVAGRIANISTEGFDFQLQEQELNTDGHTIETVSYIAWEPSIGDMDGYSYEVVKHRDGVDQTFRNIVFSQAFFSNPVFIADMQTMMGGNPSNVRWQHKSVHGIDVKIDEETSLDSEKRHNAEVLGYILIDTISAAAVDEDGDGYSPREGDCNDNDATIYPGAIEVCGDGIDQDCNGSDLQCASEETTDFVLEIGEVELNHEWQFVPLDKVFENPVVVAKPLSLNGGQPAVIRINDVTPKGFNIRIQEWEYLDGSHVMEKAGYIVMEAGSHEMAGGIHVEAGTFETSGTQTASFDHSFSQVPVVVSSVATINDIYAATGRLYDISIDGFRYALQEQETRQYDHNRIESISYIAWEPSAGTIDGMEYIIDSTFDDVTHALYPISFHPSFTCAPVFVADMQTRNGGDPANVRWQNKTADKVEVQIDEEQSMDTEVDHIPEEVGYMAFAEKEEHPDFVLEIGEVEVDDQWTYVPLNQSFSKPVVVSKAMSYKGSDPAVVRIRNLDSEGFEISVQEWDYLDGGHAVETIGYIVMEAGTHRLADGTQVEAKLFETNNHHYVSFDEQFNQAPVVAAGVVSYNGPETVTGRISNITAGGFDFRLQEQELSQEVHSAPETIACIAWPVSSGTVDGINYEVSMTSNKMDETFQEISFSQFFASPPVFVADMQTQNGWDPANVRWRNKGTDGIEVFIDEESSADLETVRTTEVVGYILLEYNLN